ncbi:MAG: HlyD family secretion protein, partial [Candidatus Sumerlaeota bacterium]|nr:HlyD family secretion protein [Candidatus Sumerlaeota bacterium]
GHVLRVRVDDNERVTSGTLLLEIDPRDYEARLAQQRAALQAAIARADAANANLALVRVTAPAGVTQASSGLSQTEFGVEGASSGLDALRKMEEQAKAQMDVAEATAERGRADVVAAQAEAVRTAADRDRLRNLLEKGAVSQQEFDAADAAATSAQAHLDSARRQVDEDEAKVQQAASAYQAAKEQVDQGESGVKQAQARVGEAQGRLTAAGAAPEQIAVSAAQLEVANADVEQARATVKEAELNLSYTQIRAPRAGYVTRRAVENGNFVQIGQPLMALVTDDLWVVANFKETELTHMRPGQPVAIHVDAFPDQDFHGHVDSIQAGTGSRFSLLPPENATGNFVKVVQRVPVKIVFDELPDRPRTRLVLDPEPRLAPGMSVVPEVKVR